MKVAIFGIGLMGGSLGLAIKSRGLAEISGFDPDEESLETALSIGAIDHFSTEVEEAVGDADIAFLATPIDSIVPAAKEIAPFLKKGSILTDVASIKALIARDVTPFMPPDVDFIGGHPMCGSERMGVGNASRDLFEDAFYFLTPTEKTRTQSFQALHSLITSLGANVISVDPVKHDEIVAIISHLPHLLAVNLVNFSKKEGREIENILEFAGGGFRDMTRIAAGNPEMWSEIFSGNVDSIESVSRRFWESADDFIRTIRTNRKVMSSLLDDAGRTRRSLGLREDLVIENMRELRIEVLDRPGVISDISVSLGSQGINIEDIEILHGAIPRGGILKLIVADEKAASKAAEVLSGKGYKLSVSMVYEEGPE